jgi:hypothetical protein
MLAMRLQTATRWRRALALAAAIAAIVAAGPASAVTIALVNATPGPPITVGESITLQLTVSGLGAAPNATSLTAFEVRIAYNEALLDFVSVSFAPFLGIDLVNASLQPCTRANLDGVCDVLLESAKSSGLVKLGEASLWAPGVVNANQPASGLLATLTFAAQAAGSVNLSFPLLSLTGTLVGEHEGTLPASATSLVLTIEPLVPVPEPGTLALVALGCAVLARQAPARRRRA